MNSSTLRTRPAVVNRKRRVRRVLRRLSESAPGPRSRGTRRPRQVAVGIATGMLLLIVAVPALARPSVALSLRGIRLLMSPDQVRHVLGRPSSVQSTSSPGPCNRGFTYRYPHELTIAFDSTPTLTRPYRCPILVNGITTRSPRDGIKGGLHVGLSSRSLKHRFSPLTCTSLSDVGRRLVAGNGRCDFIYRTITLMVPSGSVQPIEYNLDVTLRRSRITDISLSYAQGA